MLQYDLAASFSFTNQRNIVHAGTDPWDGGADGDACDDGDPATIGDVCDANLACAGVMLHLLPRSGSIFVC